MFLEVYLLEIFLDFGMVFLITVVGNKISTPMAQWNYFTPMNFGGLWHIFQEMTPYIELQVSDFIGTRFFLAL